MLKKKERLTKAEFDRFFKVGKRTHSPTLQIIHAQHDNFHGAVVVGKKVYKRAVDRNRLRRQLYGALYRFHKNNNLKGVFIVIAKPPAKDLNNKEVSPALFEQLSKFVKS